MSPMDASIMPAPFCILIVDDDPFVSAIRGMLWLETHIHMACAHRDERAMDILRIAPEHDLS